MTIVLQLTCSILFTYLSAVLVMYIICKREKPLPEDVHLCAALGNKCKGNTVSVDTLSRAKTLADILWNSVPPFKIILTGWDRETTILYRVLYGLIPNYFLEESNLLIDNKARNTVDSILWLKKKELKNVTTVTSDYHMFRTRLLCKRIGYDCNVVPSRSKHLFVKVVMEVPLLLFTAIMPISMNRAFSKVD